LPHAKRGCPASYTSIATFDRSTGRFGSCGACLLHIRLWLSLVGSTRVRRPRFSCSHRSASPTDSAGTASICALSQTEQPIHQQTSWPDLCCGAVDRWLLHLVGSPSSGLRAHSIGVALGLCGLCLTGLRAPPLSWQRHQPASRPFHPATFTFGDLEVLSSKSLSPGCVEVFYTPMNLTVIKNTGGSQDTHGTSTGRTDTHILL
jgi:hypothetical protein